ncbi:MAG: hypothetical protein AUK47_16775 [Deltaproteobacteria bacterium CG2_30_63_29]|nr:MAG: hypothetical protein AUK47_16775 [Deltaproteobacteria bacterium CG2_30_63_29]PJB40093.1 MAG: hypothetical protein CO108_15655 [Deltaproteobacteria bacterium CG_4_9_14_3_um_filter_63_12]
MRFVAAVLSVIAVALLLRSSLAHAQAPPSTAAPDAADASPIVDPAGPVVGEWTWCQHRPPLNVVAGFDEGRYFRHVEPMLLAATENWLRSLCIGDTVRLATFGLDVTWLGDPVVFDGDPAVEALMKRIQKRGEPVSGNSINELLVKRSFEYWDSLPRGAETLRALYVFTDTMVSDAPKRYLMDYSWAELPSYLQGRFLLVVSLLEKASPSGQPLIYVTGAPTGLTPEAFPSGGATSYADVMSAFVPPPVVAQTDNNTSSEGDSGDRVVVVKEPQPWLLSDEGLALLAGVAVAVLLVVFLVGRLTTKRTKEDRKRATREGPDHTAAHLTLVLRDRLSGAVVREERRTLENPLRLGSGSGADFFVPGPYSVVLQEGDEGPILRSGNLLGLEIHRGGGRRVAIAEGEVLPIKTGDRVDIGGGQEVEIRLH